MKLAKLSSILAFVDRPAVKDIAAAAAIALFVSALTLWSASLSALVLSVRSGG